MIKSFSKKLYNENDPESRRVMLEYLIVKNPSSDFIDNPEIYGFDLISKDGKRGIELEHHKYWGGDRFYNYRGKPVDLHIFQRKVHLFTQDEIECSFCAINTDYSAFVIVDKITVRKYLTDEYKEELWCSDGEGGRRQDFVYNIPQKELKIFSI